MATKKISRTRSIKKPTTKRVVAKKKVKQSRATGGAALAGRPRKRPRSGIDRDARAALVERVTALFDANALPVVELETYLRGNDDNFSLGRGMRRDFDLAAYARLLRGVAARRDVSHVLVEVHELPFLDDPADDDMWAQANIVFVVTSMSARALQAALVELNPRSIDEGWCTRRGVRVPQLDLPTGHRPLRADL